MNKLLPTAIAFLITASCLSGCGGEKPSNNSVPPAAQPSQSQQPKQQKQPTYAEININQLLKEANENAARANRMYKDKSVKITGGELRNIESNLEYISVESATADTLQYGMLSVQCYLKDERSKNKVLDFKNGQRVTVYGTVLEVGDILGYRIDLDNIEPATNQQAQQNPLPVTTPNPQKSYTQTQQPSTISQPSQPMNRNISSDLALANVSIGDSFDTVQEILGTPYRYEPKNDGKKYYFYPSVEIHCQNNRVITLISNSVAALTPRGIHEGSSLQEVLNTYGNNYVKTRYENLDLYEYNFTSQDGRSALLRFAINPSGYVDYISIR